MRTIKENCKLIKANLIFKNTMKEIVRERDFGKKERNLKKSIRMEIDILLLEIDGNRYFKLKI